ncbi:MAG: hypothetical protein DWQ02_01750 [Bacteroidetes bacterium]|nr:MAG: hypothetical protein DWQ02_01750 [Bacteroidota bacterium]
MNQVISTPWPLWRKVIFRFLCVYFLLFTTPWTWFDEIPGVAYVTKYFQDLENWVVNGFNKYIFHIKEVLVPVAGSGDTSYGWAHFYTTLVLALIGCVIWSLVDRKRPSYNQAEYWLRNIVRYYVILISIVYGSIKVLTLQMPFPSLSQMATPLGDFYPMRFSWMFIGYSSTYQIFSGITELMVAVLLFNRRTVLIGALAGIGVYLNVFILNMSFDIPVKIFSFQMLIGCIFLTATNWNRLLNFFLLNKSTGKDHSWDLQLTKRWHRIGRIVAKVAFLVLFLIMPVYNYLGYYKQVHNVQELPPVKPGMYYVNTFVLNNDTIPQLAKDSLHWKDMIFEPGGMGSVNSTDTLFRQRYHRGYFAYEPDTLEQTITFKKSRMDTIPLFVWKYEIPDSNSIQLRSVHKEDSLYIELVRSQRHFPLMERQFNWMTEFIK